MYRLHPPESSGFERCVALVWCSGCRIWSSSTVHVPRGQVLVDALASLPAADRDLLHRKEAVMVDRLDGRGVGQR
ncbi:hypothetical protein ACIPYS_26540 [Kitasatospora sp. NPDC089913]|uniref:hypothetical protein n=1 Tax=Kitasatospora sp. NPDC089913 TaxID=3364080 RepID=UPI003801433F